MLAVSERRDDFNGADIAVVTFTEPRHLAAYTEHLGVDVNVVTDVDRRLYSALGIARGSLRQVWSIGTLKMYAALLRSGRRIQRADGDVRQLGADIIAAPDGTIERVFRPATPDARPSADELIEALASTAR